MVAGLSYTPGILPVTTIRYKVLQVQLEDVVSVCKGIDSCIGLNVIIKHEYIGVDWRGQSRVSRVFQTP